MYDRARGPFQGSTCVCTHTHARAHKRLAPLPTVLAPPNIASCTLLYARAYLVCCQDAAASEPLTCSQRLIMTKPELGSDCLPR